MELNIIQIHQVVIKVRKKNKAGQRHNSGGEVWGRSFLHRVRKNHFDGVPRELTEEASFVDMDTLTSLFSCLH